MIQYCSVDAIEVVNNFTIKLGSIISALNYKIAYIICNI